MPITVNDLIARGPEGAREFIRQKHSRNEFDPTFSWHLLAPMAGREADLAADRNSESAVGWAGGAADLYERMLPGVKPEYESTRRIWTRCIELYRARVVAAASPDLPLFGSARPESGS